MSYRTAYRPDLWEKIVAVCTTVLIIGVVLFLVIRDKPFSDPNFAQFVRILMSLSCAVLGAVVPGFLHVDIKGRGVLIRAGGALALFIVTYFFAPSIQPSPGKVRIHRDPLESPSGYRAEFVPLPGEGQGKTVIWKDGNRVAEIANSRPVSFSPTDDVLLLTEYEADDDLRHFLLDIGAGEYNKYNDRREYIIGSRYIVSASWSTDGKTIILHGAFGEEEAYRVYRYTR